MRQDAQLDLRVICREEQLIVALDDKGPPDLAANLGADRNVLQIGIA